jgi:hypothetical protein
MAPYRITDEGKLWLTAEALFQTMRAIEMVKGIYFGVQSELLIGSGKGKI